MTTEPMTPRGHNWHFPRRVRRWAKVFTAPAERAEEIVMAFVQHYHIRPVPIQVCLQPDEISHHDVARNPRVNDLHGVARRTLSQPELESGRPGCGIAADARIEGRGGPDRHDARHARRLLDSDLGTAEALAVDVDTSGVIIVANQRMAELAVLVEQ